MVSWRPRRSWPGRLICKATPIPSCRLIVEMNRDPAALLELFEQYFGFSLFRPLQEDIIRDVLAGRDVFALFPTGAVGKSLCFQLPALAQTGLDRGRFRL